MWRCGWWCCHMDFFPNSHQITKKNQPTENFSSIWSIYFGMVLTPCSIDGGRRIVPEMTRLEICQIFLIVPKKETSCTHLIPTRHRGQSFTFLMVDLVLDILTEISNLAGSTMEQLLEEIASFNGIGTIAQMNRVSNANSYKYFLLSQLP